MSDLLVVSSLTEVEDGYCLHPSGLLVPIRKRPIAIDLFSGCGGMSLGIIQAGFEVVAAVDWDVEAMKTYCANLGSYPLNMHFITPEDRERMEKCLDRGAKKKKIRAFSVSGSGWISHHPDMPPVKHVWVGDIRKLTGAEILDTLGMKRGEVDLVCGGPPCQGFSRAGKQNVMDPRNSLVFEWARMVLEIMPKTFMMENVPGMLNMVTPEGIPVIDALCRVLADGGFGTLDALKKSLIATSGAGVAMPSKQVQDRKRRMSKHSQQALFSEEAESA